MRGLFFNAQPTTDITNHPSGFDREYDSDDFNRYMGVFFGNGVFVRNDPEACKVTASGLALAVAPGIALVDGGQCHFEPGDGLTITQGDGLYSVMCRRNNAASVRAFELVAIKGVEAYPAPVRSGDIYDLCLAHVLVEDGVATLTDTREDREVCGFAALTGQPPYYPPDEANLPYILWLYVLGLPMTPEQVEAVEGNPSLMEIFNNSRLTPATKEEAEAGVDNSKFMTPRRTLDSLIPLLVADWGLLWSKVTAGGGTWEAPDLYNGLPYYIGVLLIGGGGSGSAAVWCQESANGLECNGGYSGFSDYAEILVSPGDELTYVVGAGGTSIVLTRNSGSSIGQQAGVNGGTSSVSKTGGFNLTAPGGTGGQTNSTTVGSGAQPPSRDAASNPYGGRGATSYNLGGSGSAPVPDYPGCINPFEGRRILGAGGGGYGSYSGISVTYKKGVGPYGLGGGASQCVTTSSYEGINLQSVASPGTEPGCGGGGAFAVARYLGGITQGFTLKATSGAGADGAIKIYVRGKSNV